MQTFFYSKSANPKSANSPAHSATTNPQISEECQSASRKCAIFYGLRKLRVRKKFGPQIANPQIATFAEGSQI
jgi:hypothetical protein